MVTGFDRNNLLVLSNFYIGRCRLVLQSPGGNFLCTYGGIFNKIFKIMTSPPFFYLNKFS